MISRSEGGRGMSKGGDRLLFGSMRSGKDVLNLDSEIKLVIAISLDKGRLRRKKEKGVGTSSDGFYREVRNWVNTI